MEDYAEFNQEQFNLWLAHDGDRTLRLSYELNENSIVFDLGGYRGEWANQIFDKYKSSIYVFEPVFEFSNNIKNRFSSNSKVRVFNFGLGSKDENLKIALTKDSSSTFNSDGKVESIEIKKFSDFLKQNNINHIDLIKINIEGGEYDVLEHLIEEDLVKNIKNIQVQFHRFVPDCVERRNKIREALKKTHSTTYDYEFIWENWKLNQ